MDFNKISADLDFIASVVHNIEMNANMVAITSATKQTFDLDIKCTNPVIENESKFGKLLMQINVKLQDENELPDTLTMVLEGVFSADENMDDDKFMELLNINGGAVLFSIARSKIEVISSLTYIEGKITLPMVNIIQYFQERNNDQSGD